MASRRTFPPHRRSKHQQRRAIRFRQRQPALLRPGQDRPRSAASVGWGELAGFQFEKWGKQDWRIDRLAIRAFDQGGAVVDLLAQTDIDHHVIGKEPSSQGVTFIKRPAPDPPPAPPADVPPQHRLSPEEFHAAKQLRAHVAANAAYYRRARALARPSEASSGSSPFC